MILSSEYKVLPIDFSAPKLEESCFCQHPMSDFQWQTALFDFRTKLRKLDWERAIYISRAISQRIDWLDSVMTKYCSKTCPDCSDPCCHALKIFFNRADLLYLATVNTQTPPGQTRTLASNACRYLSSNGCSLPRTTRPYVCVWFLCEPQMELLREEPVALQRDFGKITGELRTCRLTLEAIYERAPL